jgi:hypothetical protein
MALNFPPNPSPGDRYTVGNKTYEWNGYAWIVVVNNVTSATFVSAVTLTVTSSTNSTSTNSGALIVNGGTGIAQDLFIGGNLTVLGSINGVSPVSNTIDVRTTSTNENLFLTVASTSSGTAFLYTDAGIVYNPSQNRLEISGIFQAQSIQNTPIGTITPAAGSFTNVIISDTTQATTASTGALIVAGGASIGKNLWVGENLYVNQQVVLTTSSFNVDLSEGTDIDIVETGPGIVTIYNVSTLESVTTRGSTSSQIINLTNTTQSTSTTTGALVIKGGLGVGKRVNCESIRISDTIFDSNEVRINNMATAIIDSYSAAEFRASKYLVQIDSGTGPSADFQVIEILLLTDNNGTVYTTEYGLVTTLPLNAELGTFSADIQLDNIVRLYFTPNASTDKVIYVLRTGMIT